MATALVIEDDYTTAEQISRELMSKGFEVSTADDGLKGLELACSGRFDVVTLDRMLPGLDGLQVVERLRSQRIDTPVLMISALSDVDERIAGLRAGGDDYIVKPFSPSEMSARIEVLLRRCAPPETVTYIGRIAIDHIRREAFVEEAPMGLLQMEYKLLDLLASNVGNTVSRRMIFENVWGYKFDPGPNLANVYISRLRKKLEKSESRVEIKTKKGEGYSIEVN